jgi:hypothetical protein
VRRCSARALARPRPRCDVVRRRGATLLPGARSPPKLCSPAPSLHVVPRLARAARNWGRQARVGSVCSAAQVLLRRQVGRSSRTRSRRVALLRRCSGPTLNAKSTADLIVSSDFNNLHLALQANLPLPRRQWVLELRMQRSSKDEDLPNREHKAHSKDEPNANEVDKKTSAGVSSPSSN